MISCRLLRVWSLEGAKKLLLSLQNVAEDLENRLFLGFCFGIEQHTCERWFNIRGKYIFISVLRVWNLVNNNHNKNAYYF